MAARFDNPEDCINVELPKDYYVKNHRAFVVDEPNIWAHLPKEYYLKQDFVCLKEHDVHYYGYTFQARFLARSNRDFSHSLRVVLLYPQELRILYEKRGVSVKNLDLQTIWNPCENATQLDAFYKMQRDAITNIKREFLYVGIIPKTVDKPKTEDKNCDKSFLEALVEYKKKHEWNK